MQADEPLDFTSAGPHESSAQAKIKQKTRQQRAQARIKRKKRAPGRPRPHPARASNKNKKKRAPATKTQKKGRPTRDYHAAPCKNHQTAKKKRCREESNPCPPSTTARDASRWPISRVDVCATMHPSLYLLGANMEKLPLINHSLVSVILS